MNTVDNIKKFVVGALEKKHSIDPSVDIEAVNYVEEGYVDSLGIIQFVTEIEEEFKVSFSGEELSSPDFHLVGGLISLIENKIDAGK